MTYHTSWRGLTKLSREAHGDETLGVGIKPYGFHAGNLASVVAYPYLFLENFETRKNTSPCFTFQVWLNDIEPVTYFGADGTPQSADWANMYPGSKSFQFTSAPNGFNGNLADYWQPAIEGVVRGTIGARFPNVVLEFHRASELIVTPQFEKTIIGCISQADNVKNIINVWNRGVATVGGPASFVWPLHPECHEPLIHPSLKQVDGKNYIVLPLKCSKNSTFIPGPVGKFSWNLPSWMPGIEKSVSAKSCNKLINQKTVKELSWAVQFRMLHTARLAVIQPNIWFMGMDHVPTNMGGLIEDLATLFKISKYKGKFLHAPLLFADGSKKISKSRGNAVYMSIEDLIDALRNNHNIGVDVKNAPLSPDILQIGPNLLPSHIVGHNLEQRMAAIESEKEDYRCSYRPAAFKCANANGKIENVTVADMLGVPHIG